MNAEQDNQRFARPGARALVIAIAFAAVAIVALYLLLPRLAGLDQTWERIKEGDPLWLALAVAFELASFGGYIWLFRTMIEPYSPRIEWRASYQISLAGVAATRLFATAGAGGVALTAWALSRAGLSAARVTERISAFLVATYAFFMGGLLIGGVGLWVGVFSGPAPVGLTLLPAAFAAFAMLAGLLLAATAGRPDSDWARERLAAGDHGRVATALIRGGRAVGVGARAAIADLRHPRPGHFGGLLWWAFDIAVLWAAFNAFGEAPPGAVIVVAYFVGMIGNTLPLPGGIGGVEGGMIGALIGFDVAAGLAIVAVLTYRAIAFWLPTIPGAIAYLQFRRTLQRWE